jgi:PAS domain S-box-containing protein
MKLKTSESNLPFQKLIENSSSGITLLDASFKVIYQSHSAECINGWDKAERSKTNLAVIVHPGDLNLVEQVFSEIVKIPGSSGACTFRSKHHNGHYIWLRCTFTNMLDEPDVEAIVCNFIDVSEQKLIELEFIKQTAQISELLETMTDGFIALDEHFCYTYVNKQALKMVGKTAEQMLGQHIWALFPDAVNSATYDAINTAFTKKIYVCNQDFYAPLQLWQENRVYPSAGGISMFIRNINRLKKEEHHLKLLESVITNTTDSVLITEAEPFDEPGPRILYVNEAFTRMTGYTADEVIGKTPRILQGIKTDKQELARLGKCLRSWQLCESTLINYKKNGEEFWTNFSLNPVADEKGWFTHWVSIDRDVTERKNEELQQALLAETSLLFNASMPFSLLLDNLLQKVINFDHFEIAEIWLTGADTHKINLAAKISRSKQMEVFYKQTERFQSFVKGESMPGAVWESGKLLTWDHLDDRSDFVRSHAARNAGIKTAYGIPLVSEKAIIGVLVVGLGKERPEASFIPLFEKIGAHFGAEIRRKQLEQELHQVFSLAPDIICILGTDRYFKRVNPAMCILLGYTAVELLAKPVDAFMHTDDLATSNARMRSFIGGEQTLFFENRYITKAGRTLWLSWAAHLDAGEGLLFCVAKDITDKKQAEQMLHASEANLNAVIENTDAFIYSLDRDFRYITYNSRLEKMMLELYGITILPGYQVFDFISEFNSAEVPEWHDVYSRALNGEIVQFEKEFRIGDFYSYTSFSIHPIREKEIVTGLSCFVNDITARKLAEGLLVESEKRYSNLFQLSPLPKLVFDLETLQFLDVNEAAISQYGYSREEFLQLTIKQLRPPRDAPLMGEILTELREPFMATIQHAITHQKKSGENISVDIQSNPIIFKGKPARIAVVRDITENLNYIHAIEAQNKKLREISWIQSHVVRAPLARIMGLVPLIEATSGLPEETRKMMAYLLQSANELDAVIGKITLKTEVIDNSSKQP